MSTQSHFRRHTAESSEGLTTRIQPRPSSDPHFNQAQPINHDFSSVNLFAHDPGPRSVPNLIQPRLVVGQHNDDSYQQQGTHFASQAVQQADMPTVERSQTEASSQPNQLNTIQAKPKSTNFAIGERSGTPNIQMQPSREERQRLLDRANRVTDAANWQQANKKNATTRTEQAQETLANAGEAYETGNFIPNAANAALDTGVNSLAATSSEAPSIDLHQGLRGLIGDRNSNGAQIGSEPQAPANSFEEMKKATSFNSQTGSNAEKAEHTSVGMTGTKTVFTGLEGIMGMAKALSDSGTDGWKRVADFLTSAGSVTSSALAATQAIEYARGQGSSSHHARAESGLPYVDIIKGSITSIKTAAEQVIAVYTACKAGSRQGGEIALQTAKTLGEVLKTAFEVAQKFYEILGKSGVPMAVFNGIPGVGIAIAAVSAILNGYKAYGAGKKQEKLANTATTEQSSLSKNYPKLTKVKDCFDSEFRGVRGTRIKYLRVTPGFYGFLPKVIEILIREKAAKKAKERQKLVKQKKAIENYDVYADALKQEGRDVETNAQPTDPLIKSLEDLMQDIQSYQYVSKMSEINQKRKVKGWGGFLDNLVSLGSQIAIMTGVGAPVGSAIQVAQSAGNATRGLGLGIQKLMRRKGNRSQDAKKKEYAEHTKYIFSHLSSLKMPTNIHDSAALKAFGDAEELLEATGVDTALLYFEADTSKKFTMVVEAMGKRD